MIKNVFLAWLITKVILVYNSNIKVQFFIFWLTSGKT